MKKLVLIPAFFVLIFLTVPLCAQVGRISGEVTDPEGNPLKDVIIRIEGIEVRRNYTVKTDRKGKYVHAGVSIQGTYRVIAEKEGYQPDYSQNVRPGFGDDGGEANFVLKPGQAGSPELELTAEELEKLIREAEEKRRKEARLAEVQAAFNDGIVNYNSGNYKQALTDFQRAAEKDPEQPAVWAYIGESYDKLKRYDDAIKAYEKAIALDPDDSAYLQNLGNIYAAKGDTGKAREYYDKSAAASAAADPKTSAVTYYNMGVAYINGGQTKEAIDSFRKAIQADDTHAEAHYQLGLSLIGPGETAESLKHLKRYLELTPTDPNAETAKDLVQTLKNQ